MPVYLDRKTNRLYIEFQYRGVRVKERLPEGATKEFVVTIPRPYSPPE